MFAVWTETQSLWWIDQLFNRASEIWGETNTSSHMAHGACRHSHIYTLSCPSFATQMIGLQGSPTSRFLILVVINYWKEINPTNARLYKHHCQFKDAYSIPKKGHRWHSMILHHTSCAGISPNGHPCPFYTVSWVMQSSHSFSQVHQSIHQFSLIFCFLLNGQKSPKVRIRGHQTRKKDSANKHPAKEKITIPTFPIGITGLHQYAPPKSHNKFTINENHVDKSCYRYGVSSVEAAVVVVFLLGVFLRDIFLQPWLRFWKLGCASCRRNFWARDHLANILFPKETSWFDSKMPKSIWVLCRLGRGFVTFWEQAKGKVRWNSIQHERSGHGGVIICHHHSLVGWEFSTGGLVAIWICSENIKVHVAIIDRLPKSSLPTTHPPLRPRSTRAS